MQTLRLYPDSIPPRVRSFTGYPSSQLLLRNRTLLLRILVGIIIFSLAFVASNILTSTLFSRQRVDTPEKQKSIEPRGPAAPTLGYNG